MESVIFLASLVLQRAKCNHPRCLTFSFLREGLTSYTFCYTTNEAKKITDSISCSKRDSVRKAREAHLINKAKTLHSFGISRRDEARQ